VDAVLYGAFMTTPGLTGRRPIRVAFTAKTLHGTEHLTDFVLPPLKGDDMICEVELVLRGVRTATYRWAVEVGPADPYVLSVTPELRQALEGELAREEGAEEAPAKKAKKAKKPKPKQ